MKIQQHEEMVLKDAFAHLRYACHNINCLHEFLKKKHPKDASLEYALLLNSLLRKQGIEKSTGVMLDLPVLGKEIGMADMDRLRSIMRLKLDVSSFYYIDSSDGVESQMEGGSLQELPLKEQQF